MPFTFRYVPAGTSVAGLTLYWTSSSSVVSPNDQPALNAARFACKAPGLRANFCSIHRFVTSVGRPYSHDSTPSANRFFARPASRVEAPSIPSTAATVSDVIGIRWTRYPLSDPSSNGFDEYPAFSKLRLLNASSLTISVAPRSSSARFALSAAGFIATSTFGLSPGVRMSREAKWIWNAETPASVPAGARISAGKFGSVARSLPIRAVASVNRLPASCIPSPESPAKRITTRSRSSTVLVI